jgi:hypothetical protein
MASAFVEGLLDDLAVLASLAPEDSPTGEAARQIARTLEASAGQRFLEALADAALELSGLLPAGHVEVRLVGREPQLVYVEDQASERAAGGDDLMSARITLRLPDSLKGLIEAAATEEGLSVNNWIVRALERSVSGATRHRPGSRLRGFARG